MPPFAEPFAGSRRMRRIDIMPGGRMKSPLSVPEQRLPEGRPEQQPPVGCRAPAWRCACLLDGWQDRVLMAKTNPYLLDPVSKPPNSSPLRKNADRNIPEADVSRYPSGTPPPR